MYTLKTTHFTCRSLQAVLLFFLLFLHSANSWADSITSDYGVIKIEVSPLTSFDYWGALYVDYELYISGNVAAGNTYKIDYYPTKGEHNYTASFYNNASASTPINSISANATAWPPEPNAITSTTQGTEDGKVTLSWGNSIGATSYEVYRSSSQGQLGDHLASLSGYSYVDTTIPSDAFHYYTIIPKAFNVWGPYTTQTVGWKKLSASNSLSATQGSIVNSVGLSWTGVAYAEVYDVYRSPSFGSIGSWIGQTSATNYTDTNSGYGTAYYYTVKPAHGGVAGNSSSQVTGWGKQPTPDQTTGVNATQGTLYAKVAISWSPANYANSYTIYRSTTSGNLGAQLASNIVGTSYDDTSVSGSTGYYYTVVSVNSTATGTNSAQVNGWGKIPSIVSNLTASQDTIIGKVNLNWTSDPDATGYEVYRSDTSGGSYVYLTTVAPNSFDDITITGINHYFYKVKARVGTVLGELSNEAEGWAKINYPAKVISINATKGVSYGKSTVTWSASTDASSYNLYRSTTLGTKGVLFVSGLVSLSYDDTTVSSNTHYIYTVVGVNSTGNGPDSDQVEGWGKVPSIISTLTATQGTLMGKVTVNWTSDPDATGYELWRSATSGGTAAVIAILDPSASSYDDSSVFLIKAYYYTIKVKVGGMTGASSQEASGWPKLPIVTTLSATKGTLIGKVDLSWMGSTEDTGYEIWRSTVEGQAGSFISAGSANTYADTTTGANTTYYYTIKTKVGSLTGYSGNEAAGWGKLPNTVSTLTATQGSLIGKIQLKWDFDTEAASYEVWRSTSPGSGYQLIGTSVNPNYEDSTAIYPNTYYYTVKIKAANLTGNMSNEASGWSRLPNAISTLTATQGDLIAKVRLKWAVDKDAKEYEIWRADTSGGVVSLLTTLPASIISYDDSTVEEDKSYYYTVKVKVQQLVGPSSNEASGFARPIPPAPTVSFKGGFVVTPGKYYVPVGQKVTNLVTSSPTEPKEKMKITITQNGNVHEKPGVMSGALYPVSAPNLGLLEERNVTIRVAWQNFPDIFNEKTITAVGGTKNTLKLIIETPSTVADTEPMVVKLKLGEYTKNGIVYDPETMGQWQTQLLVQTSSQSKSSPGTGLINMVNGLAEFTLNPSATQFLKITAVSQLISSVNGLNVNLTSSTKYVEVVKGSAIEGTISSKEFDAPTPKTFTLNLDLSQDNRIALKNASWEESTDNGATWHALPEKTGTRISILMPDPETKLVRAKMINKNNLVESYSTPVRLFAYSKLTAFITGPIHAAPGTSAVLSSSVYKDGFKINNPVVEWTVGYSSGKATLSGPTALVNESQEGKLIVSMRARAQDMRPDDVNAWAYSRYVVTFKNPGKPSLSLTGPRDVETGKSYHYDGTVRSSWGGAQSALEIVSEWELPDGSISAGNGLDWTPTTQDLVDKKPLIFRAWVNGFKDSTVIEKTLTYSPWEYVWPNFTMTMKQLTVQAPSDLLLMVNHDQPAMNRRFEGLTYAWSFPNNVTGRQNDAFPNRASGQVLFAGNYTVSVTIRDTRGHQTVLTQPIVTEQAAPYVVTLKVGKSNAFDRVPMTVTVRPTISGGHPLDIVTSQTWKVDGIPVAEYANRNYMLSDITGPGNHIISYTLNSRMGETTTLNSPIQLIANLLPVCQLKAVPSAYVVYAEAKCTDPDGKVIGYSWRVNGQAIGSSAYRVSFPKTNTPQSASVTITAMDDAHELSSPVSINVSY